MSSIPAGGPAVSEINNRNRKVEGFERFRTYGEGWNGGIGEVPPPTGTFTGNNVALNSLSAFMSGKPSADVDVLLVQIAVAMRDAEAANQKGKINIDQEAKKAQLKEKEAKLEEAQRKIEEAEAKQNSSNIFDKIKLAFEWLTAILAIVAAVLLIATGAGAVAGTMMLAAAGTSLIMAVDSTVMMATGNGIAGNLALLGGASEEEAAKADMGFKISLAVIGILLSLGAGIGGAASGASAGTSAALQAAKMAQKVVSLSQVGTSLGMTATNVASTAVKYEESELRSDAKSLEADAKTHEAVMQMLDDLIDQALSRLMAASDRFNQILEEITEAIADRGSTLARVRFAG